MAFVQSKSSYEMLFKYRGRLSQGDCPQVSIRGSLYIRKADISTDRAVCSSVVGRSKKSICAKSKIFLGTRLIGFFSFLYQSLHFFIPSLLLLTLSF